MEWSEAPEGMTVYFSTYQSIDVAARAQAAGLPQFDLVICDGAHRTAGFTLADKEQSSFLVDALEGNRLDTETEELEPFYASVRRSVTGIKSAESKQNTIKRLYEKFFAGAFRGTSERLGIVYTPNEIVDFILHSADEVLRKEFGASLSNEGVHSLDPFTGTGTFIVRLLQSRLIKPEDLRRKYRYELHANEIVLLAYYVAAVNIEETYHGLAGGADYEAFHGIVLTYTFQASEDDDRYDDQGIFGDNNERVRLQNALDIRVIVGNPPYSSGQDSNNDDNQNLKYKTLDERIAATYAARSSATLKDSLYDSYIRAFRWASDRVKDCGVVAFVTNSGFLDGNTADGLRKVLFDEFSSLYVLNLRGNQRTAGEKSRREGGKVFGSGSRATVVISVLVKNPETGPAGTIHYRDGGDYLTAQEKLAILAEHGTIGDVPWEELAPNASGDWLNQRDDAFANFTPIASKRAYELTLFETSGSGAKSNRDSWVYNSSKIQLRKNVTSTLAYFNDLVANDGYETPLRPTEVSWSRAMEARRKRKDRLALLYES